MRTNNTSAELPFLPEYQAYEPLPYIVTPEVQIPLEVEFNSAPAVSEDEDDGNPLGPPPTCWVPGGCNKGYCRAAGTCQGVGQDD